MADLELNRIPLANIAMKCPRLARLTGDEDAQRWFQSEMAGYDPNHDPEFLGIGWKAGRGVNETTAKPDSEKKIWTGSISSIEATIETLREEPSHLDVLPMTEGSSPSEYYIPGAALN